MKSFILLFAALAIFVMTNASYTQTLTFCEGVDDSGNAIGANNIFYIPNSGGYFYFLVNLPKATNCSNATYDIFEIRDGVEIYNSSVSQTGLSNHWTWFWQKVTFRKTGYFRIYVNDCKGITLTSAYVTINYQ